MLTTTGYQTWEMFERFNSVDKAMCSAVNRWHGWVHSSSRLAR